MSTSIALRLLKTPAFGFTCLSVAVTGITQAGHFVALHAEDERRAIGWLIGLVIVAIGLILPRLRPRTSPDGSSSKAALADRCAAVVLIPAGIAYVALFALASLDQAKSVSPMVAIATLAAMAACCSWLFRERLLGTAPAAPEHSTADDASDKNRRSPVLLFGLYLYLLATVGALLLWDSQSSAEQAASWMVVIFWMLYTYGSVAFVNIRNRAAPAAAGS